MNRIYDLSITQKARPSFNAEVILLAIAILFMPLKRGASLGWIGLPWELTFYKIFAVMAFAVWVTKSILNKNPDLFSSPFRNIINIGALLYLLVSVLSIFNSTDPSSSLSPLFRRFLIILFYILLINTVLDKKAFRFLIILFLVGIAIESMAGIYELITGKAILNIQQVYTETVRSRENLMQEAGGFRVQGFALDPDWHAYFMIIGTGIALAALFSNYIVKSKLSRSLLVGFLVMMVVNVITSASRSSWIGVVISFGTFLLFVKIRRKSMVMGGILILLIVLFIGAAVFTNVPIYERLTGESGSWSISMRWEEAKLGMSMFQSHPIFGVGTGNSVNVRNRYHRASNLPITSASTNGYLIILAENGLLGFSVYLLVIFSYLSLLIRVNRVSHDHAEKIMVMGLLSAFLPHVFLSFFYPVVDSEFLWFLIGMGCVMLTYTTNSGKIEAIAKPRVFPWNGTIPYPKKQGS